MHGGGSLWCKGRRLNPFAMKRWFVLFLFLLPFSFGFHDSNHFNQLPTTSNEACTCPGVSNIQITEQGTNYISFSWTGAFGATQYKLWYYRVDDEYTNSSYFTSNTYYTYSSLPEGRYTFYFQSICGSEPSGFIG